MASLNCLLELTACREFPRRFCGFFAHYEHRRADGRRRNFEVIGGRLTRSHLCHRRKHPSRTNVKTRHGWPCTASASSARLERSTCLKPTVEEAVGAGSPLASGRSRICVSTRCRRRIGREPRPGKKPGKHFVVLSVCINPYNPMTILTSVTGNGVATNHHTQSVLHQGKTDRL